MDILKKTIVAKNYKFSLYALKFIGNSNRNRVPCNRRPLKLHLTKAKYSINRLSLVEKENGIVQINPSNFIACKKKNIPGDIQTDKPLSYCNLGRGVQSSGWSQAELQLPEIRPCLD
jgi:hypothetical protein